LLGAFGKPGLAGSSPGSPLGDAPVPIVPGVEVFGTPATGGATIPGDVTLDPVVPVPGDGTVDPGAAVPAGFPGAGIAGLGVAPRPEPAGPLVPPAVCAFAWLVSASSATIAMWCTRIGLLLDLTSAANIGIPTPFLHVCATCLDSCTSLLKALAEEARVSHQDAAVASNPLTH
jgi:hypothetical protein